MITTSSGPSRHFLHFLRSGPRTLLCLFLLAFAGLAVARGQLTYSGSAIDVGSGLTGATINAGEIGITTPNGATVITAVTFTSDGAANGEFGASSNTCVGTVVGPGRCNISLNFTPKQTGLRRGALTITSVGNAPLVIYLHGVGMGSQLVFAPDAASAISTVTPLSPIYYSPTTSVYDGAGNLFFNDILNSRILEQSATGTLSTVLSLPGNMMSAIAISPTGTLFVSVPSQSAVYAITPGGASATLTFAGATISQPSGLAVDGAGNLYIADAQKNQIVRSAFDGSSATVLPLTGLSTPLSGPEGLMVDANGNIYIVDNGNQRIVKLVLSTGAATPLAVTGQLLYNSFGATTDASSAIYLADTGNRRILRITAAGAASVVLTPGFAFSTPTGVTLAANGDIIVADNNVGLTRIVRSAPSTSLTFPTATAVGAPDTADGSKLITLQNIGNTDLGFVIPTGSATNPSSTNAAFQVASASTCPILTSASTSGGSLVAGASCTYAVSFTPSTVGANTGALVLTERPTGSATTTSQSFTLSGTGLATIDSFTVTATPSTTATGVPETFTVTAFSGGVVTPSYRGTVTLTSSDPAATFLSGTTYTFTAADSGTHTFAAPAGGITFNSSGTFTISAKDGAISATSNIVTVKQTATTAAVSLTAAPNPAVVGTAVALTATVTSSSNASNPSAITGTVTFFDGATALATVTLVGGKATLSPVFTTAATHNLTAVYNGDTSDLTNTSAVIAEVVKYNPTIALTATPNPAVVSTSVTLSATVSSSIATVPTGTVSFFDGGGLLSIVQLVGGKATVNVPFASYGPHSITATYNGDNVFFTATSTALTEVIKVSPSINFTATPNPVGVNAPLTLTALITSSGTPATPGGTITFFDGSTALGTVTLSGAKATLTATLATTGSHVLTATYSGDSTYTTTSSMVTVQVKAAATLAFTATPNPVSVNNPLTLTATVTSTSGAAPTGTVTFLDGATALSTVTLSGGVATLTQTYTTAASHTFTATYNGDGNYLSSTLTAIVQVVKLVPAFTFTATPSTAVVNTPVTLATTVTSTTSTTPTGTVTFFDGATALSTVTLSGGAATLSPTFTLPGTHTFTATYNGDANFAGSSLMATVQVVQLTPAITLTTTPNAVFLNNPTAVSATVASTTSTVPTGTVTFFDGGTPIATIALTGGVASFNPTFAVTGSHIITATYSGDATFIPVTSNGSAVLVEDFTFTNASTTGNTVSILPGATATYTFTLTPVGGNTFPAAITFAVTGLPTGATYTLTPASVASGAAAASPVLVVTVPQLASLHPPPAHPFLRDAERVSPIAFGLLMLPFLKRRNRKRIVPLLMLLVLAGATLGLTGCLSDQASGYFGQAPGTYTVTVTATSGTLSRSANVTLTVQ